MTPLQAAVQEANRRSLPVQVHAGTGNTMIDGMRWDLWMKYKDQEVTVFRGQVVYKIV